MSQSTQTLTIKHFQIAHLLAQGKNQAVVARKLNISPATVHSCLQNPEFNLALEDLRKEYEAKLAERIILPFAEMQNRINEESLGALSRVVDLSHAADKDSVRLKANLALLDRSSNTPKATSLDPASNQRELFPPTLIQLILQTAIEMGDTTILASAERELAKIPTYSTPEEPVDVTPPVNPFIIEPLENLLHNSSIEEEYGE